MVGAAKLIARFGSPATEADLWQALAGFRQKPPAGDPAVILGTVPSGDLPEGASISAIVLGYHGYPTRSTVKRLQDLCVAMCDSLGWIRPVEEAAQAISVQDDLGTTRRYGIGGGYPTVELGDVLDWIGRYPSGTKFFIVVEPGMSQPSLSEAKSKYPGLTKLLRDHRMEFVDTNSFDEFGRCKSRDGNRY